LVVRPPARGKASPESMFADTRLATAPLGRARRLSKRFHPCLCFSSPLAAPAALAQPGRPISCVVIRRTRLVARRHASLSPLLRLSLPWSRLACPPSLGPQLEPPGFLGFPLRQSASSDFLGPRPPFRTAPVDRPLWFPCSRGAATMAAPRSERHGIPWIARRTTPRQARAPLGGASRTFYRLPAAGRCGPRRRWPLFFWS